MYGLNNGYFRILRIYVGWDDEAEKESKFKLLTRLNPSSKMLTIRKPILTAT
jgi:hypothetical protein